MKFRELARSQTFFEISKHVLHQGRFNLVKIFLTLIATLPLSIAYKFSVTLLRAAAVVSTSLFLLLSLGISKGLRDLFVKQAALFAANIADWVLYPFAIATSVSKFLLAMLIHPSLFFRY